MRARPTPPDKKRLRDRRDHVASAEYPHALRNHWSTGEARTHRAFRRAQHQRLELPLTHDADDGHHDAVVRRPLRKWGATPLGESVKQRLWRRTQRTAYNLFKRPYHHSQHERAVRFFTTMLAERSPASEAIRASVREALIEPPLLSEPGARWLGNTTSLRAWLDGFLRDDPTWAPRLRAWSR